MLEIAVASGKGGVGKSTLSSTLILYLKERGYDIIAVDADADAPNLHLIFEVERWDKEEPYSDSWVSEIDYFRCVNCGICHNVCTYGAVSLVEGRYYINPMICEGCLTCSLACPEKAIRRKRVNRGVIRLSYTKYGFPLWTSELSPGRPNSGRLVTEIKNRAKAMAKENTISVVDSAAGIGCQVISSLSGANVALLVAEPTPASLSDLKRIHTIAKQFSLPSALVINKYDMNSEFVEEIIKYAREENIDVIGMVPYDDHVPKAMAEMRPLIKQYNEAPASKALVEIARIVEERIIRGWSNWSRSHRPSKPARYVPIIIKPGEKA
ncbi:MAG: P-loop NTPase [Fervidicoccaceae archaeon]